ncbi:hypothetical protein ARNL5_00726 [Anaerolineae bacterium]|nr:hypothetical protein ARNL5_00726 [Anaerolineae bacterium]
MPLPVVIEEIVRAIGHGPAMALVRSFGGQELRIPRGPGGETWAELVEVLGEEVTCRLAAAFGGGEPIYIALCTQAMKDDRNRQMVKRYDELLRGNSARKAVAVLVREFAPISYRQVETIVNTPLAEQHFSFLQQSLFPDA